jgi:hypothetical protein
MNLQTRVEGTNIILRWDYVDTATQYEVWESIDNNTTFVLKTTLGNVHNYTIAGPAGDHIYFYKIVANDVGATTSNEDFILYTSFDVIQELKAILFNLFRWNASVYAITGTNIFAAWPLNIEAYPCLIFELDSADLNSGFSWNEMHTLRVKIFSRDADKLSDLSGLINKLLIDFSYQGKKAIIHRAKKISHKEDQMEDDEKTLMADYIFLLNIERTEVS